MSLLQLGLREAGVIGVELHQRCRGVVAGIAERDRPQFALRRFDPKHRDVVIDGTIRVRAVLKTVFRRQSAIHGNAAPSVTVREFRRLQVFDRQVDHTDQLITQFHEVRFDALSLLGVERIHD